MSSKPEIAVKIDDIDESGILDPIELESGYNLETIKRENGLYIVNNPLNAPSQDEWFFCKVYAKNESTVLLELSNISTSSSKRWVKVLKDSVWGNWNEIDPKKHTHTKEEITNFPTSLPANGGNADTVDGKHASDFLPKTNPVLGTNLTLNSDIVMNGIRNITWNSGRQEQSKIYWNANVGNDFGLTFEVDGIQQFILEKDKHPKIKINGQWKTLNSSDNTEIFYTDLVGILDESQTSETDLATNLYTIINTIPMYAKVKMYVSDVSRPKLYKSIKAKCEADGITGIPNDFIMCIEKANNPNLPNKVMIWDNQKYREIVFFYDRIQEDNKLSKAGVTFNNGEVGSSVVKSVQRGVYTFKEEEGVVSNKTINISTINPSKSSVNIYGDNSGAYYISKVNNNNFIISSSTDKNVGEIKFSWEVVEYA